MEAAAMEKNGLTVLLEWLASWRAASWRSCCCRNETAATDELAHHGYLWNGQGGAAGGSRAAHLHDTSP